MKEKVNILISVYDKEKPEYLDLSIRSIEYQTLKEFKLVLVEDGPLNEELQDIVRMHKDFLDDRMEIIKIPKNIGLAGALNRGLNRCNAQYIARMDSDDVMVKTRLEKQFLYLESNKNIDVVGSNILEIDENANPLRVVRYPSTHKECRKMFVFRDCFAHPAVMFRKTFFDDVGNYSEKHKNKNKNEDTNLWFRGFMAGKTYANIQEVLLLYRRTEDFYFRRVGLSRAINMARDRLIINKEMKYGMKGYFFIFVRFILNLLPKNILKQLYKLR